MSSNRETTQFINNNKKKPNPTKSPDKNAWTPKLQRANVLFLFIFFFSTLSSFILAFRSDPTISTNFFSEFSEQTFFFYSFEHLNGSMIFRSSSGSVCECPSWLDSFFFKFNLLWWLLFYIFILLLFFWHVFTALHHVWWNWWNGQVHG